MLATGYASWTRTYNVVNFSGDFNGDGLTDLGAVREATEGGDGFKGASEAITPDDNLEGDEDEVFHEDSPDVEDAAIETGARPATSSGDDTVAIDVCSFMLCPPVNVATPPADSTSTGPDIYLKDLTITLWGATYTEYLDWLNGSRAVPMELHRLNPGDYIPADASPTLQFSVCNRGDTNWEAHPDALVDFVQVFPGYDDPPPPIEIKRDLGGAEATDYTGPWVTDSVGPLHSFVIPAGRGCVDYTGDWSLGPQAIGVYKIVVKPDDTNSTDDASHPLIIDCNPVDYLQGLASA